MAGRPDRDAVVFFESPEAFGRWLEANHDSATEVWLGQWKKHTGRVNLTWSQAVDEALRFGWVDSVKYRLDGDSTAQRFTPRKPRSNWSAVNVAKVAELTAAGRMHPAGIAAFAARTEARTGVYSFERDTEPALEPEQLARFRRDRAAWAFFEAQPAGYRRGALHWVVSAKRAETRERRFAQLLADSSAGLRVKHLRR